jgi:hypothetical protein
MSFWDSSALIPLCTNEPRSIVAGRLWKSFSQKVVWWATTIEICSALARVERENKITNQQRLRAEKRLEVLEKFGLKFVQIIVSKNLRRLFRHNTK